MKAIVSVFSKDRIGIIADVCVMLVDTGTSDLSFGEIQESLAKNGEELGLNIRIQREDIFDAMHKV